LNQPLKATKQYESQQVLPKLHDQSGHEDSRQLLQRIENILGRDSFGYGTCTGTTGYETAFRGQEDDSIQQFSQSFDGRSK